MVFVILSVRRRPGLVATVLTGGGLWLLSVILETTWPLPGWANIALEEGTEMLGTTLLVAALAVHLVYRFVLPAGGSILPPPSPEVSPGLMP